MKHAAHFPVLTRQVTGFGLLALAWLFLLPIYDRPVPWIGWLLVLGAVPLLLPGAAPSPSAEREPRRRARLAALAAALGVGLLLPMPFRAGFLLLGAGWALTLRPAPRLGAALASAGAAFLMQGLCLVVYVLVCSAIGELRLGSFLAPLLHALFGLDGVAAEGQLHLGATKLQLVTVTPDSLGALVPLLIAAPLWALSARGSFPARVLLLVIGYAAVRYAAILAWCAERPEDYALLLTPLAIAASYLPLFALLCALPSRALAGAPAVAAPRLHWRWYASAAVAAACTAYGVTGIDPGVEQAGRILVDDSHGAWESGTAERSMENFGTDSTYTYSALWDWAAGYYPVEIKTSGELTEEDLRDRDVLVLKTPSHAYSAAERSRIEAFVERGGGLLAIGDHTDVFGTTTVLNSVLQPFGVQLERNVGLLIHKRFVGDYRFRKDGFFGNPLTHGIDALDFMGPASVSITDGFPEHVMQCQAQVLEQADYRDSSFFGDRVIDLDDAVRPFYACAAKRHGAGRVVVWGDSTVFSNFSMFETGKPEVMLSILSYLNKTNALPAGFKPTFRVLGVLLALGALGTFSRRRSPEKLWSLLAGGAAGLVLVAAHGRGVAESSYTEPPFDRALTVVGYDSRNGRMGDDVPPGDGLAVEQESRNGGFESLFQAAMRLPGCFPRAVTDYDELADLDVLFLIDSEPLSGADEEALMAAIRNGLRLVVVESESGDACGASSLLAAQGMSFRAFPDRSLALRGSQQLPRQIAAVDSAVLGPIDAALYLVGWEKEFRGAAEPIAFGATLLGVSGGAQIWVAGEHSVPVLARATAGPGSVYAFAAGGLFRSEVMGQSSSVILPYDPQMSSYRVFEALLAEIRGPGLSAPDAPATAHSGHDHGPAGAGHGPAGGGHGHGDEREPHAAADPEHEHAEHAGELVAGAAAGEPAVAQGAAPDAGAAERSAPAALDRPEPFGPPIAGDVFRARVSVLLKNSSQAAFGGGYAVESDAGGALQLAMDSGTGRLGHGSPRASMILTPTAFALLPYGNEAPIATEREATAAGSSFLLSPAWWSEGEWTEELLEGDPWELVSRGLRRQGLADIGNDLLEADFRAGGLPEDGWEPLPEDVRFRVLRSTGVVPLGGELVGQAEVWIGERSGRPRKVKLTFRLIGAVGEVDWYDVVILYDDYQVHRGFPLDLESGLEQATPRWVDLNEDLVIAEALGR